MTSEQRECLEAVAAVADAWTDPEHPARSDAVDAALEDGDVRASEESIAYALNHFADQVSAERLADWLEGRWSEETMTVGLWEDDPAPGDGLRAFLAICGTGRAFAGCLGGEARHLVPRFAREVQSRTSAVTASFVDPGEADALFARSDAVFARPTPDVEGHMEEKLRVAGEEHGIPPERRHLRRRRFTVGVIDGDESEDEREGLAEDMLLHEGRGPRRLALLWAPEGLSPDPVLEAMATFRGVFPAHDDTPGALQMQQAFLEARDVPHAYAAGLQFLLSRGAPDVQKPAHVRWSDYGALSDAREWLSENRDRVYALVARGQLQENLEAPVPVVEPGTVRRPPLDDPEGKALMEFLDGLAET